MAAKINVVLSQGQSQNPSKRKLEEDLLTALLLEPGVETAIVPHLYDLTADGTGMLCLRNIGSDLVLLSWLFPRAAHWTLDRNGVRGHFGTTLLKSAEDDEDEAPDAGSATSAQTAASQAVGPKNLPNRRIYCLDLKSHAQPGPYLEEIRRIAREARQSTVTMDLRSWMGGASATSPLDRLLPPASSSTPVAISLPILSAPNPAPLAPVPLPSAPLTAAALLGGDGASTLMPGGPLRIEEDTRRRWYPVIDYSRCTNCMECLDFCLFGVYGVDRVDLLVVEQPDNCKKGCPACSRVCPENAIIFPQHKTPTIAGSPGTIGVGLKIDLSKLFGAPDALEQAVLERDQELVADGRDAVGMQVGVPKRSQQRASQPKDDLDQLLDQLDELNL